jgi:hypothetical protein
MSEDYADLMRPWRAGMEDDGASVPLIDRASTEQRPASHSEPIAKLYPNMFSGVLEERWVMYMPSRPVFSNNW